MDECLVAAAVIGIGGERLDCPRFRDRVSDASLRGQVAAQYPGQEVAGVVSQPRRGDVGDGRRHLRQAPTLGELGDAAQIGDRDFGVPDGVGGELGRVAGVDEVHSRDAGNGLAFLVDDIGHVQFRQADQIAEVLQLAGAGRGEKPGIEQGQRGLHPGAVRHPDFADGRALHGGEGPPDVVEGFLQALEIRERGEVGSREMRGDRYAQVPRLQPLAARFLGLCLRDAGLPVAMDVDTVAERAVDDARYQRGQCVAVPPAGAVGHVVAAVRLAGGGMKVEGLIGQNGVFVVGHAVQVLAGDVFRIDADHEIEGIEQAH